MRLGHTARWSTWAATSTDSTHIERNRTGSVPESSAFRLSGTGCADAGVS